MPERLLLTGNHAAAYGAMLSKSEVISAYPITPQTMIVELLSERPVVAITINHEDIPPAEISASCEAVATEVGLPAVDVLRDGAGEVVRALEPWLRRRLTA